MTRSWDSAQKRVVVQHKYSASISFYQWWSGCVVWKYVAHEDNWRNRHYSEQNNRCLRKTKVCLTDIVSTNPKLWLTDAPNYMMKPRKGREGVWGDFYLKVSTIQIPNHLFPEVLASSQMGFREWWQYKRNILMMMHSLCISSLTFAWNHNPIRPKHWQWNLSITTNLWDNLLPSEAHLGGQGPPRWAPEGRNC